MRTMQHNSRANASGRVHGTKHNDRNFDVTLADNIDADRIHLNEYWHLYQDEGMDMTFEQAELRFYEEHFAEQLQQTNDKYRAGGHPERCRDMAAWKMVKRNAPEETTLQIGKMEEHIDGQTLMACFQDYNRRLDAWNEAHGRPFTQLTYALHEDEAVPHIQTRRVWHYTASDGTLRLGQEQALEQAGVELPHPDEKAGRRNNRKMAFDAMARQMWLDIIHDHGIDVEREALPNGRHNRDKEDMIRDKYDHLLHETQLLQDALEVARREAEVEHSLAVSEREKAEKARQRAEEAETKAKALEGKNEALAAKIDEQRAMYLRNDAVIQDQEAALGLIQTVEQYQDEALDLLDTIDAADIFVTQKLPDAAKLFMLPAVEAFLQYLESLFDKLRKYVQVGIQRLKIYERTHVVDEPLSEPVQKRASSLDETIAGAFAALHQNTSAKDSQKVHEK